MTSVAECLVPECSRESSPFHKGYCTKHHARNQKKAPVPCSVDGCTRTSHARGWCSTHYRRWHTTGSLEITRSEPVPIPVDWTEEQKKEERDHRHREYNRKNSHRGIEYFHQRRARLEGVESEEFSRADVVKVYGTDCHICGEPIDLDAPMRVGQPGWETGLHIDHKVPISLGGGHTLDNCRPSHGLCNLSKGGRLQ